MSDIRLFKILDANAKELHGEASDLERPLQNLIESNLETFLGVRFLATEYATGRVHGGRIDTLGLDENYCPVIIEYKRSVGENVINQGLFYLDWLMDHQAELELLVQKKLDRHAAELIDWDQPRLICIAGDFTKYDGHAVQQINRNIDLVRYRFFGQELGQALLLLEQVNSTSAAKAVKSRKIKVSDSPILTNVESSEKQGSNVKTYAEGYSSLSKSMLDLLSSIEDFMLSLNDDVVRKELKLYLAFKRLKNFATIVIHKNSLSVYLHLNADLFELPANAQDVRDVGHWGTGDVKVSIASFDDFEAAKSLFVAAYEGNSR